MSRRLPPLIDALVTVVLLVALGLIVLRLIVAASAHGEETWLQKDPDISFQSPHAVSIVNGSEELVRIGFDGSLRFGPHYMPDTTARIFWQSIAGYAPGRRARHACFARLWRERVQCAARTWTVILPSGVVDGGGGGGEPGAWNSGDRGLRPGAGGAACPPGTAADLPANRAAAPRAGRPGDVGGRDPREAGLSRRAGDGACATAEAQEAAAAAAHLE